MADPLVEFLTQQQLEKERNNPFISASRSLKSTDIPYDARFGTWNNILAQAGKGLASGLLGGYGEREVQDQATADYGNLVKALNSGDFSATPELSKFGQLYKAEQAQEQSKNDLALALLEKKMKFEPPDVRTFIEGTDQVQKQWDPASQSYNEIGRGPRWAFAAHGGGGEGGAAVNNNEELAALVDTLGLKDDEGKAARAAILGAPSAYEARQIFNSVRGTAESSRKREQRPLNPGQIDQINATRNFSDLLSEAKTLADQVSSNRIRRVANSHINTGTPEFKLSGILNAAQQAYARARDSGALSKNDIEIYDKLFADFGVLDSKENIINRLKDLDSRSKKTLSNNLDSLRRGGFDVSQFMALDPNEDFNVTLSPEQAAKLDGMNIQNEDQLKAAVTGLANAAQSPMSDQAYKEAYKAKLRAQRGY